MSKISKEGYEQITIIRNALDSMYNKLNKEVFIKDGKTYKSINLFDSVKSEFNGIATIVSSVDEWEKV